MSNNGGCPEHPGEPCLASEKEVVFTDDGKPFGMSFKLTCIHCEYNEVRTIWAEDVA